MDGRLPVDICVDNGATEVTVRVAGGRLDGPLGNHPEAYSLLRRIGRVDIIDRYRFRSW
jgi:hypothetical protein